MKIMMVNGLHMGGVRRVIENLVPILRKRHDISLFLGLDRGGRGAWVEDRLEDGVRIRNVDVHRYRNTRLVRNYRNSDFEGPFRDFLLQVKPDVLHFHSCTGIGASTIIVASELRIPFLVTMHDWWWLCPRLYLVDNRFEVCSQSQIVHPDQCYCVRRGRFEEKRYRYLWSIIERIPLILVPSAFIGGSLVRNRVPREKIRVNPNGIPHPEKVAAKSQGDHLRFGFLGGSDGFKGGLVLLKAAHRLHDGFCVIKMYNYRRAGVIGNKAGRKSLMDTFRHGLVRFRTEPYEKWLQFKGFCLHSRYFRSTAHARIELLPSFRHEDIDEILQDVDVVIVPSVMRESFNLVTREAMIRKTPVISSDSGGPEEVIKDGVNGFIFRTNDDGQLAERMGELIKEPEIVERFRNNIRRESIVDIESQSRQLEVIYSNICKRDSATS
jgi:glycosyltransferase involved in cell wall biosynthesis